MNQRVLVASNRGPVSYQFGADGSLTGSRGGGGMIAGVTDGLAALGPGASVTWICAALSDADRAVARSQETGPRDERGIPVRMLDIAPGTFDRAYNNVANSTLWFLLHQLFDTPSQPRFGREFRRDWESYLAYNEAFADALTEEAQGQQAPGRPALGQRSAGPGGRPAGADPGLPPVPGPAAAPRPAGRPAGRGRPRRGHRALLPHPLGAA